jgi:14-3-3 protein epsilon
VRELFWFVIGVLVMAGEATDEGGIIFDDDNIQNEAVNLNLCLIGRFLTEKSIRTNIMKEHLANLWMPQRQVTIKKVAPSLFLFQFYHRIDKDRVVSGGPWSFENHMLVVNDIKPGDVYSQIPLNHMSIWVQVHQLPAGFMTRRVGEQLGNYLGGFLEYDNNNNTGFWRRYMRIRVRLDVRSPLKKEEKVKGQGGEWSTVSFRYERLGIFCYLCGVIGHSHRLCPKLFIMEVDDGVRGWGQKLRAEFRRGRESGGSRWLKEDGGIRTASNNSGVNAEMNGINGYNNISEPFFSGQN